MYKNPNYIYGPSEILVPAKLNFGEYILNKLWKFKENVCFIDAVTDEPLTYHDIAQEAMNLAVSLSRMGVGKGHTVALCSENRREYFPTVIGVICTGATLSTINIGYSAGEIKHVMNIAKPNYIFCSPLAYKMHEKTLKSLPFLKKFFLFDNKKTGNELLYNDIALLERNVKFEEFEVVDVQGQTDDLFILYSSGTTGLPKGVVLTHLNVITACCLPTGYDATKLALTITPWYHVMGLVGNLTALATGRTAVYLAKFDLDLYLKTIEKYKIFQLTIVPPVLVAVCKAKSNYDLSSVKLIYSGAAPLHRDTLKDLNDTLPKAVVLQGYGMTEVTLAVTRDTYDEAHLSKTGSVGYVLAGITLKIADTETRQPLGPNQRGEICVKGPLLMKGYYGFSNPEDFDDEGFFKTGDIGYYDNDKAVFVVDRLKELIKYKGYQVPPAEIEATLLQHESIKDAGVIGIEDSAGGEVPLAFVVRQPGTEVTEVEIKQFVADKLSNPKHLRGGVRFLEQIPKNLSGKILRKVLRTMVKTKKSKL